MPTESPLRPFRRSVTGIRKSQRVSKHPAAFESQDNSELRLPATTCRTDVAEPSPKKGNTSSLLNLSRNDHDPPLIFSEWMEFSRELNSVKSKMGKKSKNSISRKSSTLSLSPSPTESVFLKDQTVFQQELLTAAEANPEINVPRSLRHVAKKFKAVDYSAVVQDENNSSVDETLRAECNIPDAASLISEDGSPRSSYHTPNSSQPDATKTVENSPNEFFSQPSTFLLAIKHATVSFLKASRNDHDQEIVENNEESEDSIRVEENNGVFRESLVEGALDLLNKESLTEEARSITEPAHPDQVTGKPSEEEASASRFKSRFTTYEIPDEWPFAALLSNPSDHVGAGYRFSQRPKILPVKPTVNSNVPNQDRNLQPSRRFWRPAINSEQTIIRGQKAEGQPTTTVKADTGIQPIRIKPTTLHPADNESVSDSHPQRKKKKQKKQKKVKRGHKWRTFRRMKNRLRVGNDDSFFLWQMSAFVSHGSTTNVAELVKVLPHSSTGSGNVDDEVGSSQAERTSPPVLVECEPERTDESLTSQKLPLSDNTSTQSSSQTFHTAQSQLQVSSPNTSDKEYLPVSSANFEVVVDSDFDELIALWCESSNMELGDATRIFSTLAAEDLP